MLGLGPESCASTSPEVESEKKQAVRVELGMGQCLGAMECTPPSVSDTLK